MATSPKAGSVGDFLGFGSDAQGFLEGLEADNSKAYFDGHRSIYDKQIAQPMKALVLALGEQLVDRVSTGMQFEPKIGRSLFRINRDLRFSKDKTPYHPYVDAVFWEGESPRTSPSLILRIKSDSVLFGGGVFGLQGDRLERFRRLVVDDRGAELERVIADVLNKAKGASLSDPQRKRVPRGFPADHSRSSLLLHESLHVSAEAALPASFTNARFVDWLAGRYEHFADLHGFLVAEL